MQDLSNQQEVLACGRCLAFVDTGDEAALLKLAARQESRRNLHDAWEKQGGVTLCNYKCGQVYCSEECRAAHEAQGHAALCVGALDEAGAAEHPLMKFKMLAIHSNEILLLAADAIARTAAASPGDAAAAVRAWEASFGVFVGPQWPDVVSQSRELAQSDDDSSELCASLKQLCEDAAELLSQALVPTFGDSAAVLCTADRVSRLIGTFEHNNIGVRSVHPLNKGEAEPSDLPGCGWGQAAAPGPLEGTSLYSRTCCANHSCDPSLDVIYLKRAFGQPLRATLVARRPVFKGEELAISYIDAARSRSSRRAATTEYGFLCACSRCDAAGSEDHQTDDEDWETDDEMDEEEA